MGAFRWVLRIAVAAVGLLAGCFWESGIGGRNMYGVEMPQHDPTVELTDFSYAPPGPAHTGDILHFSATASKKTANQGATVVVRVGSAAHRVTGEDDGLLWARLNDDGNYPDKHGGDGVYSGQLTIPYSVAPQAGIPLSAYLDWYDGYTSPEIDGPPLSIEEGEAQ